MNREELMQKAQHVRIGELDRMFPGFRAHQEAQFSRSQSALIEAASRDLGLEPEQMDIRRWDRTDGTSVAFLVWDLVPIKREGHLFAVILGLGVSRLFSTEAQFGEILLNFQAHFQNETLLQRVLDTLEAKPF